MLDKVNYKDVIRFSFAYWGRQKKMWPVLLGLMGLAAVLDTLFPVMTGVLVSAIDNNASADVLLWTFVAFLALEFFYHTTRNGSIWVWNRFALKNLRGIVTEAFGKVQRFSTDWHANSFAGGTVRKITRGMWSFDTYEDIIFMYLYPTAVVMLSTIIIMAIKWPIMGLVTAGVVVVYVASSIFTVVKINAPRFRRSAAEDTKVGAALADAITGCPTVKSFGREKSEELRFGGVVNNWSGAAVNAWQVANGTDLIRRYISILMMGVMVGSAILLWKQGRADTGDVVFVFTSFIVLSAYLRHIGEQVANLQRAITEMEDVIWYWKTDIVVKDAKDAKDFVPGEGEIVFDKVTFAYKGQEEPIYKDFDIRIAPGEKVALVGHSGSGKSTFVKVLQRLYDIQDGQIRVDGQCVAAVTQSSLRKGMALVPQEPILFHRSLAENIAYGKPEASMDEIIAAAKQAYAHEFIEALSDGYKTLVGERGIKLSGGERQRVAIARAILADAPVLILDEATSALDSVSEHYIQKALDTLMEGRTTITIAHRLATIKSVDRILVFDQGRIVEQGRHDELVTREGSVYRRLFEMQALDLVGEDYAEADKELSGEAAA